MKELEFLGETVYKSTYKGETLIKEPFYNFGARSSFKYTHIEIILEIQWP